MVKSYTSTLYTCYYTSTYYTVHYIHAIIIIHMLLVHCTHEHSIVIACICTGIIAFHFAQVLRVFEAPGNFFKSLSLISGYTIEVHVLHVCGTTQREGIATGFIILIYYRHRVSCPWELVCLH